MSESLIIIILSQLQEESGALIPKTGLFSHLSAGERVRLLFKLAVDSYGIHNVMEPLIRWASVGDRNAVSLLDN